MGAVVIEPSKEFAQLVAELGHRVPSGVLHTLCRVLEKTQQFDDHKLTTQSQILTGDLKNSFRRVLSLAGELGVSPVAVALAIRCATENDEWWRSNQRLRLIWTGPDNPADTLGLTRSTFLGVIAAAKRELWIVSFAAYGVQSVVDALLQLPKEVQVNFLLEAADEGDMLKDDSIKELAAILEERAQFYIWPREKRPLHPSGNVASLHAKCVLADEAVMLVSSANLTEAALERNMELGLLVEGGREPAELLQHLHWLVSHGEVSRLSFDD